MNVTVSPQGYDRPLASAYNALADQNTNDLG